MEELMENADHQWSISSLIHTVCGTQFSVFVCNTAT